MTDEAVVFPSTFVLMFVAPILASRETKASVTARVEGVIRRLSEWVRGKCDAFGKRYVAVSVVTDFHGHNVTLSWVVTVLTVNSIFITVNIFVATGVNDISIVNGISIDCDGPVGVTAIFNVLLKISIINIVFAVI